MNRFWRLLAAIAVMGGALAWYTDGFGYFARQADPVLALNGNIDIRQVDLAFRVGGHISTLPVEEGARVEAGAVLGTIDQRSLRDQLAANEARVETALAQLNKLRNGNREQEIAQAEAAVAEAEAQLVRAQADFDRRTSLVQTGAVSRADFDSARSQFRAAQARVTAATAALSLQRAGARPEDVRTAEAQVALAQAERDKTRTDLVDTDLRAPNTGVILTRAREPGAIVQPGETVMTLTIDRPMRVRAYIDAIDLGRISPGMPVEVSTDGVDRIYHGTIGFISPTAEFTPKTVQTRELRTDLVYRIRVIVNDPDEALRQGQPVTVRVPAARPLGLRSVG
ncbi:MAG: HlyD family efflux transporter periplasmic adaptor subunit [Pseudomonadota bacterium]